MSGRGGDPERPAERPQPGGGEEEGLRFGEAMAEIEEILRRIEGEKIDIDDLAEELRRASQLLELARAKIRRAEVEVTQIVQSLEADRPPPAAEDEHGDAEDGEEQDDIPF